MSNVSMIDGHIDEPKLTNSEKNIAFWCENQMLDENNIIICIAHLTEGRVFDCPYKNNAQRLEANYPCSDYKEKSTC